MLVSRLGFVVPSLYKINRPATCLLLQRNIKKKSNDDDEVNDKPIPYSQSDAAKWKAEFTRMPPNKRVWYSPHVITASVAIFMLYFCVLREENDIDELIYRPLPETLKGIDKLHPEIDFYTKPDYVQYHENRKAQNQKDKKTN